MHISIRLRKSLRHISLLGMTIRILGQGDHHISSDYLILLAELAFERGLSTSDLLKGTGLTEELFLSPDTSVGHRSAIAFIERFCQLTQEIRIAVEFGKRMTLSSHGTLGFAAQCSETMEEAGNKVTRFMETRAQIFTIKREPTPEQRVLSVTPRFESELAAPFLILAFLTSIETICRTLVGSEGKQAHSDVYIDLGDGWQHDASSITDALPHCTIHQAPQNQLVWPVSALLKPLPFFNPEMEHVTEQRLQQILDLVKEPETLRDNLKQQLASQLPALPTIDKMAEQLHMSAATLNRKLKAEGVTFQQLKDELRFEQAKQLLTEDISLDAIAAQLGYSDASNFIKAFKNWAGESPAQFRGRS